LYGDNCVACPAPRVWDFSKNQCICPAPKTIWSGIDCQCPAGTYGDYCVPCPAPRYWDNVQNQCICRSPFIWDGSSCSCPQPYFLNNGNCVKCPEGYQWTNGRCQECHCTYVDVKFWGDNSTAVTGMTTGPYNVSTGTSTVSGSSGSTSSGSTTSGSTTSGTTTSGSTTSTGNIQYKCP